MASLALHNSGAVLSRQQRRQVYITRTTSGSALITTREVALGDNGDDDLVVRIADPIAPAWVQPTAEAFAEILNLPPGWNSYGARKVERWIVDIAGDLLVSIMEPSAPPPSVVPTTRGGLQLEWHKSGVDIEISINPMQPIEIYASDDRTGEEWEDHWPSAGSLLPTWIAKLDLLEIG
jgi:hypothetical protein